MNNARYTYINYIRRRGNIRVNNSFSIRPQLSSLELAKILKMDRNRLTMSR